MLPLIGLAFRLIFFCLVCTEVLSHSFAHFKFSFSFSFTISVVFFFISKCIDTVPVCVIICVWIRACTHHLHACVPETWYYRCGSLPQQKRLKWYPDLRHQTPEASWVMVHRLTARTKGAMVKRMEIVEERDRWSRQKTSSLGSAANSVRGLRLWGLCQPGSGGKVAPLRKRVEERMREMQGNVWGTKGLDDRWS